MIPNAVAIINGKGGTFKTTITTHTGALLAAAGHKVLLVDLDEQGNVIVDLGADKNPDINDQGGALAASLNGHVDLVPAKDLRPGLDVAVGGDALEEPFAVEAGDVDAAVAPIAGNYDIVLFDCPPGGKTMRRAALTAARFAIIPTQPDAASLLGIRKVATMFAEQPAAKRTPPSSSSASSWSTSAASRDA